MKYRIGDKEYEFYEIKTICFDKNFDFCEIAIEFSNKIELRKVVIHLNFPALQYDAYDTEQIKNFVEQELVKYKI